MSTSRLTLSAGARRRRRFGRLEAAILLAGALGAAGLVAFTGQSISTLEHSLSLARVTQEIHVDVLQSQRALFQVSDGDHYVDVQRDVVGNIEHASADCRALLTGREIFPMPLAPLKPGVNRDAAAQLCDEIDGLVGMTKAVVADPQGSGDGSDLFEAYELGVIVVDDHAAVLSSSLNQVIAQDTAELARLGTGLAGLVLLVAGSAAVLASRQRRLLALKNEHAARLAAIVDSSVDAIVGETVDGRITSWNLGAERLYGYSSAEMVGRNVELLIPQDRRAVEMELLQRVGQGEQVQRYETERQRKDGRRVPVALTMSPVFTDGQVETVSVIGQDISELQAKDQALEAAREEALESSRLKSEFLATMSHEIRTPMNGVIGLTTLLLDTRLSNTQRQYAEGVAGAGEALLAVINDILDFSKLEAGKVDLDLVSFDPRRLVEEVASLLAVAAHSKELELVAYCRPEVPSFLLGDAGRIRQILLNLASNAVKFTPSGEVAITASVMVEPLGSQLVRFQVIDTGIGVSAEGQQRLFESFTQADASTTRRFGGTGLGLAISRKLTEAMGGTIGMSSVVGAGSTFWFQVPLPVPVSGPGAATTPSKDGLDGLSVLVVDDNATNRLVLESQLTAWGMRPTLTDDPLVVMDLLRTADAAGQPYELAVLDMCMPDLDGLGLARLITADPVLRTTRLIMLTSSIEVRGDDLRQAGVSEWLTKPVRSSEFYDRLMRLMTPVVDRPVAPSSSEPSAVAASLGRILVVEDNAVNQMVARGMVAALGYQVDVAVNGVEALEAVATTPYAAVLMDCHMPVMDGFAATVEIRRRQRNGPRLPIIAMTAAAMSEDRDRCLEVGMDDYVSKPVAMSALGEALKRWVPAVAGSPDFGAMPPSARTLGAAKE